MGTAHFKKEPTALEITQWLGRVCRKLGCWPGHIITDDGPQFTAEEFGAWCRRHGIQQRFGAIGKYGHRSRTATPKSSAIRESVATIIVTSGAKPPGG